MKRKRHSPEQAIRKLRTADQLLNQGQKGKGQQRHFLFLDAEAIP